MEVLIPIAQIVVSLVALKALIGFRFPWEQIVKDKRSLRENLESIKDIIPQETYAMMRQAIEQIH